MPVKVERLAFGPSGSASTGSFREFVRFVHDAFNGAGFINQFPSGAINTASVDPPNAVNQVRGYNVWAFGDVLQTTQPLFVRVEFRSLQPSAFNAWGLNVYLGERHDASGTLDSLWGTSSVAIGSAVNGGIIALQQTGSYLWTGESGSRVAMVAGAYVSGTNADYAQFWFNLNRTQDWNGNLTPSGAVLLFGGGSGSSTPRAGHIYHSMEIGKRYTKTNGNTILISGVTGSLSASVSPYFVGKGQIEPHNRDVLACIDADTAFVPVNLNITGSQYTIGGRPFYRLPTVIGGGNSSDGGNGNFLYRNPGTALLMRIE